MTLIEHSPAQSEILDFIDDSIRMLREAGHSPAYIVVGSGAYKCLRLAIAARFNRTDGEFESYANIPVVVDPVRTAEVLLLPRGAVATGCAVVSTG